MDTSQELINLIIFFLKEKNSILKRFIGLEEYTEKDYKDINRWNVKDIINFFERLIIYEEYTDVIICPWCSKCYSSNIICSGCTYGKRHGKCNSKNSNNTYGRISNSLILINNCHSDDIIDLVNSVKESYKILSYRYKLSKILR